jgi:hypothetical protein
VRHLRVVLGSIAPDRTEDDREGAKDEASDQREGEDRSHDPADERGDREPVAWPLAHLRLPGRNRLLRSSGRLLLRWRRWRRRLLGAARLVVGHSRVSLR